MEAAGAVDACFTEFSAAAPDLLVDGRSTAGPVAGGWTPDEPHNSDVSVARSAAGTDDSRPLADPALSGAFPPPFPASALALLNPDASSLHLQPAAEAWAAVREGAVPEWMREQLESAVECIGCLEAYCADGLRAPKLLPCGHSLCLACLTALLLSARRLCPTCGETRATLPDCPAVEYPCNWDLRNIARALEGGGGGRAGSGGAGGLECAECATPAAPATHACRVCVAALCRAHALAHARGRATAAHGPPVMLAALLADLGLASSADLCAAHLLAKPCPSCAVGPATAVALHLGMVERGAGRAGKDGVELATAEDGGLGGTRRRGRAQHAEVEMAKAEAKVAATAEDRGQNSSRSMPNPRSDHQRVGPGAVATAGQVTVAPAGARGEKMQETRVVVKAGGGETPILSPTETKKAVRPAAQLSTALVTRPRHSHPALVRPRPAPTPADSPAIAPVLQIPEKLPTAPSAPPRNLASSGSPGVGLAALAAGSRDGITAGRSKIAGHATSPKSFDRLVGDSTLQTYSTPPTPTGRPPISPPTPTPPGVASASASLVVAACSATVKGASPPVMNGSAVNVKEPAAAAALAPSETEDTRMALEALSDNGHPGQHALAARAASGRRTVCDLDDDVARGAKRHCNWSGNGEGGGAGYRG
jgi:hypothetical protein